MNKNIEMPISTMIDDRKEENLTEPNLVNPSFVDVNKIENESKDIFVEKPSVNIEDLLKTAPKNIEAEVKAPETQVELKNDINEIPGMSGEHGMPAPKFFSFFPPVDENEENTTQPETIEPKNVEVLEKTSEGFDLESITNNVTVPQHTETQSEGFSFDSIAQTQNIEVPVVPTLEPSNDFVFDSIISQPVEQPEEQELPEMKESKIEEQITPEYNFQNLNPIIHNDFVEAPSDEELELIEEEETIPEEPVYDNSPKQMKDVIRVIRDCNDIIESYGYKIETEEFDLETMYQVIFKVFKN